MVLFMGQSDSSPFSCLEQLDIRTLQKQSLKGSVAEVAKISRDEQIKHS